MLNLRNLASVTIFTLALSLVWPRYMLFSVGGVFVSPYNLLVWGGVAILIMGLVVSSTVRSRAARVLMSARGTATAYAIWVIWRVVCDMLGVNPSDALDTTFKNVIYLETPILFFSMYIFDVAAVARTARLVVACCILTSSVGLYEWIHTTSFLRLIGWDLAAAGTEAARLMALTLVEQYRNGSFRAASVYNHPLVFSQLLASLTPFVFVLIATKTASHKIAGIALILAVPTAIYISGTRSGFIVAGISVASYILFSAMGKVSVGRIFGIFVVALIFWFAFGSSLFELVLDVASGSSAEEQASSLGRDQQWILGLEALWNSPVFGYGDGQAVKLAGISGRMDLRSIDSYYLSTLLNFGLPGLLALLGVLVSSVLRMLAFASASAVTQDARLFRGMASSVVALGVGFSVLAIPDNFVLVYAFAGCVLGLGASRNVDSESAPLQEVATPRVSSTIF